MPIPSNKTELLEAINKEYNSLSVLLSKISKEDYHRVDMLGHKKGSRMCPKNLVSYLIGWANLVLEWAEKIERKQEVVFPHDSFKWTELGDLAEYFYKKYDHRSPQNHLQDLDNAVHKIIELIESKSNETLYNSFWYKHYTMGRMIQLNTSSPYKNASARIRKWNKLNTAG